MSSYHGNCNIKSVRTSEKKIRSDVKTSSTHPKNTSKLKCVTEKCHVYNSTSRNKLLVELIIEGHPASVDFKEREGRGRRRQLPPHFSLETKLHFFLNKVIYNIAIVLLK